MSEAETRAALEAIARAIYNEGAWCGDCEYSGWDSCSECRDTCMRYARAVIDRLPA